MEKIELQEIIDACEQAKSDYLQLYRPLLGYEENIQFYRGIDDSMQEVLEEIEAKVGLAFPADFLQLYLISNGGKYFDVTLYSLSNDKEDVNGLYYKNMNQSFRNEYDIPQGTLVVGENSENQYILIGVDDEGYYGCYTWSKEDKDVAVGYDYLLELLMLEIDYHTGAFDELHNEEA